MKAVCRLYRAACRRFRKSGLTFSASAWVHAQETGNTFWRNRIDGAALLFFGQANHCQASHQRERANHLTHEGPRQ